MILPLYVCRICGKFGGLALSFLQTMSRSEYKDGDHKRVFCPSGHGLMYEVQDDDRLSVLPATVEAEQEMPTNEEKVEYNEPSEFLTHSIDVYFRNRYGIPEQAGKSTSPDGQELPLPGPSSDTHTEH